MQRFGELSPSLHHLGESGGRPNHTPRARRTGSLHRVTVDVQVVRHAWLFRQLRQSRGLIDAIFRMLGMLSLPARDRD